MLQSWPKAFYLEASILRKLPIDIMNAEMQRLQGWSKALSAGIHIPEVSWKEWNRDRMKLVRSHIDGAHKKIRELAGFYSDIKEITWPRDKEIIISEVPAATRRVLDDSGIGIIPTPQLDLNMLIDMSVRHTAPFEKKDKGFRDAVNLLTVLEFAKSIGGGPHLFIAEDNAYKHPDIRETIERYEVDMVVCPSITECISMLEDFNELVRKRILIYQKTVLKEFLRQKKPEIENYIKQNAGFPVSSWRWALRIGVTGTVEEVSDIKVVEIDSVTRGVLPDGQSTGRVKLSFVAKTNLTLLVRSSAPLQEERLKCGERASPFYSHAELRGQYKTQPLVQAPVPTDIRVEGTVLLETEKQERGPEKEKYSDLKIENIVTQ